MSFLAKYRHGVGSICAQTYCGIWYWGKRRLTRVEEDGEKKWKYIKHDKSTWDAVEVPAIISREMWEAAQAKLRENKHKTQRYKKHNYLLARRVTCGVCGYKMQSIRITQGYQYYRCPSGIHQNLSTESCKLPYFRVDKTDAAVWEWVVKFLSDPEKIEEFIADYNEYKKVESEPVYERIEVIDKLLGDNRQQLERLLDLYLTGDFPKDVLIERQRRLESQIEGLEEEKTRLQASLKPATIAQNQLDCLSKIARGLDIAKDNFEAQRRIIKELNLRVTLWVEGGEKKADISLLGNYQGSTLPLSIRVI